MAKDKDKPKDKKIGSGYELRSGDQTRRGSSVRGTTGRSDKSRDTSKK